MTVSLSCTAQQLHLAKDNLNCLLGFKNDSNEWAIPPVYQVAWEFNGNFAIVGNADKYGTINKEGKAAIPMVWDNVQYLASDEHAGELYKIEKNGKWGIADTTGKVQVQPLYTSMGKPLFGAIILQSDTNWAVVEIKGWQLYTSEFKLADRRIYPQGMIHVRDQNTQLMGVVDTKGHLIIPAQYTSIGYYSFGDKNCAELYPAHRQGGTRDIYVAGGKMIAGGIRETKGCGSMGMILVKDGKAGMIDCRGGSLLPIAYEGLEYLKYNSKHSLGIPGRPALLFKQNGKWGVLDNDLKPLIKAKYDSILPQAILPRQTTGNASAKIFLLVRKDREWGVVNNIDSVAVPLHYEYFAFSDDLYDRVLLARDGKMTAWVPGQEKLLSLWEAQRNAQRRFFRFRLDPESSRKGIGVLNKEGEVIVPPKYHAVNINEEEGQIKAWRGENPDIYDLEGHVAAFSQTFARLMRYKDGYAYALLSQTGKVGVIKIGSGSSFSLLTDTVYHALKTYNLEEGGFWLRKPDGHRDQVINEDEEHDHNDMENYTGNWGFVDTAGNVIVDFNKELPVYRGPVYSPIIETGGQYGVLKNAENWAGEADEVTEWILEPKYESIKAVFNNSYIFKENKHWGLANSTGKVIIPPVMDGIFNIASVNKAYVLHNGKLGLIDSSSFIIRPELPMLQKDIPMLAGMAGLNAKNRYGIGINLDSIKENKIRSVVRQYFLTEVLTEQLKNEQARRENKDRSFTVYSSLHWGENPSPYGSSYLATRSAFELMSYSKRSFSFIRHVSACTESTKSEGVYCQEHSEFYNLSVRGDSVYPLTLDSLFQRDYQAALTGIITQKLKSIDNPDIDCSHPEDFLENYGDNFILDSSSFSFYIPYRDHEGFSGEELYEILSIPYPELKGLVRKGSVLEYFLLE